MFWAALAIFITTLTGEGDDTRTFLNLQRTMIEISTQVIEDEARRAKALGHLEDLEVAFTENRQALAIIGICIEKADRNYRSTVKDYQACRNVQEERWKMIRKFLVEFKVEFQKSFTVEEFRRFDTALRERGLK